MTSDTKDSGGKAKAKAPRQCPFCDAPMEEAYPFCKTCGQTVRRCAKCGRALTASEKVCPRCKE